MADPENSVVAEAQAELPTGQAALDEVARMAKARLEAAVAAGPQPPVELLPDPLVLQAQAILSQAAARNQTQTAVVQAQAAEDDIWAKLPQSTKQMLRGFYMDPMTGETQPYFIGTLKTYSSKAGYGFIACNRAMQFFGTDVFIHKNQVPVPWNMGQPVEFAVISNNRGQPQATDCFWLPLLPGTQRGPRTTPNPFTSTTQGGYMGSAGQVPPPFPKSPASGLPSLPKQAAKPQPASSVTASTSPTDGSPESTTPPTADNRNFSTDGPFFLGTLKSFSSAQGYGFLQCEDVFKIYSRDIYFDRAQLPRPPVYTTGQTCEFAVSQNNRGQPQARCVVWEPVPLCPSNPKQDQGRPGIALSDKPSKHSPQSLDQLRKLLRLLNEGDQEAAVVTAIDYQGATVDKPRTDVEAEGQMPDIDYVTYVLDRLGNESQAMSKIKDFVKMLLLLMIAKMLRKRFDAARVSKLARWLTLLASAIDPSSEKQCQEHFMDVVSQIENNLRVALNENPNTQETAVSTAINNVLEQLRAKAANFSAPPAS